MDRTPYRLAAVALAIAAWALVLMPFGLRLGGLDVDLALAALAGVFLALVPAVRPLRAVARAARRHPDVAFGLVALALVALLAVVLASHAPTDAEVAALVMAAAAAPAFRPGHGRISPKSLRPTVEGMKWDPARWPNFKPVELACKCPTDDPKGCKGEYFHDAAFLDALQRLRDLVAKPLRITSGRRCARRNGRVGGASRSQHLVAIAVDISLTGHDAAELARQAVAAGFTGIGFGKSFLHVDMREGREGFHYPGGQAAWTARFGFDPAARFDATGKL